MALPKPPYEVLAYYLFTPLKDPHALVKAHHEFLKDLDIRCRVYLSEEGINGQLSGSREAAAKYRQWLHAQTPFKNVEFKIHQHHENVFPRQTVKYRKQLVALDKQVDAQDAGGHVSPKQWREMMESDQEYTILDVRNDYESRIGHFQGAVCPDLSQFRDFRDYAKALKHDKKAPKVMMYCTGGIRCELYSQVLKEEGIKDVYQLQGGVIKYGLEQGDKHWHGQLFVFDDRLKVPLGKEAQEPISTCQFCSEKTDQYYNCANMCCNALFLACPRCLEKQKGCCSEACQCTDSTRPLSEQKKGKPFRRAHLLHSS